jgi:hypothetical protein
MEMSPSNLESAKLFIQPIGLNVEVPSVTTRKVDLSSGYNGSTKVIGREDGHVELERANMSKVEEVSTREIDMLKGYCIMKYGGDKSTFDNY